MANMDVFKQDAFSMVQLTDVVNKMPFVPGRLGRMGIFEEGGVTTTDIEVEEYQGSLSLIPASPRGAPPPQNAHNRRIARKLSVPHLVLEDTVRADEIQGVRAFGSQTELQGVQQVVNMRFKEMMNKHDATVEYGRVGAIKGIVLDADGSTVLANLFNTFNVVQQTKDFNLGTATNSVLNATTEVAGMIEDELGMDGYEGIHAYCGVQFWEKLISHPTIIDAYNKFQALGQTILPNRQDLRFVGFPFGSIVFEQYRGKVPGSNGQIVPFIADNEAYAFPVGVPGLFVTRYAPADFMETVNTNGLPRYARQAPDTRFNQFTELHTQSNPLSFCKRPRTLIKLTSST